jgi:hypothetical protein
VGWPKYDAYAALDPLALRGGLRQSLDIGGKRVAGFFGQPLRRLTGYAATAAAGARAVAACWPDAVLLHRPHPRESDRDVADVRAALAASGLAVLCVPAASAEECLCACDLVLTPFSSCGLDMIHLCAASPAPLGAVLYLLLEEDVARHYRSYTGLAHLPPAEQGMALEAASEDEARARIAALDGGALRGLRAAAAAALPPPGGAADRVLRAILSRRANA